jgi:hypothetical protein
MNQIKSIGLALLIIVIIFTLTSLFDIFISVIYSRFYSTAAFIVTFGVGGIFASFFAYTNSIKYTPGNKRARWMLIAFMVITGILFAYPLSVIEGGEYQPAFVSFAVTLALTSFLFIKGDLDTKDK